MLRSFKRGVHPQENKFGTDSKIKPFQDPRRLVIPLRQHLGREIEALVQIGESVKMYQKIAGTGDCMCAPIHSPTSGKVTGIEEREHPGGGRSRAVIIEPDGKGESVDYQSREVFKLSPKEIIDIIRDSGIVGMGGASCPTALKIDTKKKPELYILNGCECEPYITADHRLMMEYAREIIEGLKILMKATGVKKAIVGIEENKDDAIKQMKYVIDGNKDIRVEVLKTKYPQGAENMLIYALTGKKLPAGTLPIEAGVVVNNVATAKAVHDAVESGKPLVRRVVTVTGDVKAPVNLDVMIGTTYEEILEGRLTGTPKKIINGGPMMGNCVSSMDVPVVKGTSCILVLNQPEEIGDYGHCIRCGRCLKACPMNLSPTTIARYSEQGKYALCKDSDAMDCFECGICSYVCPAKIPLTHLIRSAKKKIKEKKVECSC